MSAPQVGRQEQFSLVINYLRKKLGKDQVLAYLKEAFTPSPEEHVGVLADAFGGSGKSFGVAQLLVVNYALSPAWG